ncbi:MAG TPA: NAD-dependent epimerase/dehydratase family protein [Candidatus Paceibacterota bacterium]|nr:NAD-dependent epimerase/dehydratase family protein [Candidatus Paceibacterota bacterium]
MKILITGGTGYVGSRVAEVLAKQGQKVVVVDIATPEERGITFSPGIEFRHHDLRIPSEALKGLEGASVVLHLAADIGSLTYMHDHQAEILTNNSAIDAAVYPALVAHKIPHVIYSSSSMVFQYPPQFPYTEGDIGKIRPPSNVYGFAKLGGEYFCRSYAQQFGLGYTVIRYHNIYGPGEDSKGSTPGDIHVIPALLQKVLGGQYPLEFLGNPEATRPFTYVDDAVAATADIVMRAARGEESVKNNDFNIGNNKYYTILELGKTIWEKYGDGRPFEYKVVETKADTALRREVDITKIREKLGWSPKVGLEEGLEPVAKWIRERGTGKRSLW